MEYFERRAFGKHIDASRLFLYKTTRNLMQVTGDTGAWLRETMGALVLCGVPDEKYWPYNIRSFDREPGGFVYRWPRIIRQLNTSATIRRARSSPQEVLSSVKKYLEPASLPCSDSGALSRSRSQTSRDDIPYPCKGEKSQWGHAVAAVGYDDEHVITNLKCKNRDQRRSPHPQLLGHLLGRRRLRLDTL